MNENYYKDDNYNSIASGKMILIVLFVSLILIIIAIISISRSLISTYNHIIDIKKEVKIAESNMEDMIQIRLELLPNLTSTLKDYSTNKEQLYIDIAVAREILESSFDTGDPKQISEADEKLTIAINNLIDYANNYNELTEDEQYSNLIDQLRKNTDEISNARKNYNQKVTDYNKIIEHFPGNIFAEIFGFNVI